MAVPTLFFVDEILYRKVRGSLVRDEMTVYSMMDREFQILSYSYVLRNFEQAYKLEEVGKMINRSKHTVFDRIYNGDLVGAHAVIWPMTDGTKPRGWRFSPKGVEKVWEFFAEMQDRISKDPLSRGQNKRLPSRSELRAMLRNEVVMYIKDESGEFRPTWKP